MGKIKREIKKFLERVEEKTDVPFSISEQSDGTWLVEGEYWSDLGEDIIIPLVIEELTLDEIVHAMYEFEENFDAEEHATELFNLRGAHGTPSSLRALLNDADEQQAQFIKIYEAMLALLP